MKTVRHRCSPLFLSALLLVLTACSPQQSPPAPRPPMNPGEAPAAAGAAAAGSVIQARSIRVQDGDSFIARLGDGRRLTVRLSGIDAPEQKQPFASVSRRNLIWLLEDQVLQVHVAKYDQYGRAVAQVFAADGGARLDVGLAQLHAGMAWFYRRYRDDLPPASREPYAAAEDASRQALRGLWRSSTAQPPWEFRRGGREP